MAKQNKFEQILGASQTVDVASPLEAVADRMGKSVTNECHPPAKVAEKAEAAGVTKGKLNTLSTLLLGGLAGVFIGLGQPVKISENFGLKITQLGDITHTIKSLGQASDSETI